MSVSLVCEAGDLLRRQHVLVHNRPVIRDTQVPSGACGEEVCRMAEPPQRRMYH